MPRVEIKIDRAIYQVNDSARRYWFVRRNPEWRTLSPHENEKNKRRIDGYTRVFNSGQTKVYRYHQDPCELLESHEVLA
jgi:hypothetical protein